MPVPPPPIRRDYQLGSYILAPQQGQGSHIATCTFVTHPAAEGKGVDEEMLSHALQTAAVEGYRALQLDYVVSTNDHAIDLLHSAGFNEVGRLPGAFAHPTAGFVDALIMHKLLGPSDLSGWLRHNRTGGASAGDIVERTPEDESEAEELRFIKEVRSGSKLPSAQKLPAPEAEKPEIDEYGFEVGKWDLGHLVHMAAFHIDSMFFNKKDPDVVEKLPTYMP